jgi:hypothetical protein
LLGIRSLYLGRKTIELRVVLKLMDDPHEWDSMIALLVRDLGSGKLLMGTRHYKYSDKERYFEKLAKKLMDGIS